MAINMYLSIITLNVNGLSALSKRHRVPEWIKKTTPIYMLSLSNPTQIKRLHTD